MSTGNKNTIVVWLFKRFSIIYGQKFLSGISSAEMTRGWVDIWTKALSGTDDEDIQLAAESYAYSPGDDWPPSLPQFLACCEAMSGVPSWEDALEAAVRSDFYHPIIKFCYNKVGSWTIKNEKTEYLEKKFKAAYQQGIKRHRASPELPWDAINAKGHLHLSHSSKPLTEDSIGLKSPLENIHLLFIKKEGNPDE